MLCSKCSHTNPDDARFCLECGSRLSLACAHCGTALPADSKFCSECGANVVDPEPAPVADHAETIPDRIRRLIPKEYADRLMSANGRLASERRLVTILFCDITGSTAMAEHLDPEDVIEIMNGAFDVLIEPIMRYEGTLARLMGDAILAFFGAPIAHEDDPERACRAALEIVEGAQHYASRLEQECGISGFNVRVGINTGLVVVGEVGSDLRVEYTAMGDAINVAARMEAAAVPGTALITEATQKLIAPLFEIASVGPIQVKGKVKPVSAFLLRGFRFEQVETRRVSGLQSSLVGRDSELAALREALSRLQAGIGGIVTIVGEAGIGKSRLVAELRKEVAPYGVPLHWFEGRCVSYGSSMPYSLWLDIARSLLDVSAKADLAGLAALAQDRLPAPGVESAQDLSPYLANVLSLPLEGEARARLSLMGGGEIRSRTFQAFQVLIAAAARRGPVVLVCEDLHWADATSLDLLEQLVALTETASLLVICLFRPLRERGCWQLREMASRVFPHRHIDIWLDPLSSAESRSLMGNLLQTEALPPTLEQRILGTTEGNPFFTEEILRGLVEKGALVPDEDSGGWRVIEDAPEVEIPRTLEGLLLARIDGLPEDTKRVLQTASVIGRTFSQRILAAIAEQLDRLEGHLLVLQREEMIRQQARLPEAQYFFKHDLTREAAYNSLLKKDRRVLHRKAAEALETLFPERIEEHVGLLAHHWEEAGAAGKAVHYLLRAADSDVRHSANEEAIVHFTRGLALVESMSSGPERSQLEFALQMGLGAPVIATKGYGAPEVGRAWGRALELSQQMGDPPQLWPARSAICQYYILRAEHQTALEIADQMAEEDQRTGEALTFPFPRGPLGIVRFYLGDFEPARLLLEQMVARYDLKSHRTSAFVYGQDVGVLYLSYLAWVLWFLGYADQARERSGQALGLAKVLNHPFTVALAMNLAGRLHSCCRDHVATEELAVAASEVAGERGLVFFQAAALGLQGWVHVQRGAPEVGEAEIQRSMSMWRASGAESHRAHFLAWLAQTAGRTGRLDEGLDLLTEALRLVEKTGERYYEAEIRRLQAEFQLELGHPATAETGFQQAIKVARSQSARSLELRATLSLCRLLQRTDRKAEARVLLTAIYGWFTEGFDTPDLRDAQSLLSELG